MNVHYYVVQLVTSQLSFLWHKREKSKIRCFLSVASISCEGPLTEIS